MVVINVVGGPGAGKSTNAAALFALMKRKYYNVEYVHEYAKDLTYQKRFDLLAQQNHVLETQDSWIRQHEGTVDWVITDGALLNSAIYVDPTYHIAPKTFKQIVLDYHNKYNSINFFIRRTKKYVPVGRSQTESQARDLDSKIEKFMDAQGIPYYSIIGNDDAPKKMLKCIRDMVSKDIDR